MFGSAIGSAGNFLELAGFMRVKEHPQGHKVNARARGIPAHYACVYWIGGFGSRLLPASIAKV